jgi:hypothetical protein
MSFFRWASPSETDTLKWGQRVPGKEVHNVPGPTPHYPPKFKREALELYRSSERSIPKVANELAIHHSDQGVQYTALSFSERLREVGIKPSVMGRTGSALDNDSFGEKGRDMDWIWKEGSKFYANYYSIPSMAVT